MARVQTPDDSKSNQDNKEQNFNDLANNCDYHLDSSDYEELKSVTWWRERYKVVVEQLERLRLQLHLIEREKKFAEDELRNLRKQHESLLAHIDGMARDERSISLVEDSLKRKSEQEYLQFQFDVQQMETRQQTRRECNPAMTNFVKSHKDGSCSLKSTDGDHDSELSEHILVGKGKQEYETKLQTANDSLQKLQLDLQLEKGRKQAAERRMSTDADMSTKPHMSATELELQHSCQYNTIRPSVPIPKPRRKLVMMLKAENERLQQAIKELEEEQAARMTEKYEAVFKEKLLLQEENASFREELKRLQQDLHDAIRAQSRERNEKTQLENQLIALSDAYEHQEQLNHTLQEHDFVVTESIKQHEEFQLQQLEEYRQLQYAHETVLSEKGLALEDYHSTMEKLQALRDDKKVLDQELWQTCQKLERTELQLASVEETLLVKDTEIERLKGETQTLQDQVEVFRLDFEAERKERLIASENKKSAEIKLEEIYQNLQQLKDENVRLNEEINSQGNERLQELQRRRATLIDERELFQPCVPHVREHRQYYHYGTIALVPIQCPVCQLEFPDMDTFEIHSNECIK